MGLLVVPRLTGFGVHDTYDSHDAHDSPNSTKEHVDPARWWTVPKHCVMAEDLTSYPGVGFRPPETCLRLKKPLVGKEVLPWTRV